MYVCVCVCVYVGLKEGVFGKANRKTRRAVLRTDVWDKKPDEERERPT